MPLNLNTLQQRSFFGENAMFEGLIIDSVSQVWQSVESAEPPSASPAKRAAAPIAQGYRYLNTRNFYPLFSRFSCLKALSSAKSLSQISARVSPYLPSDFMKSTDSLESLTVVVAMHVNTRNSLFMHIVYLVNQSLNSIIKFNEITEGCV